VHRLRQGRGAGFSMRQMVWVVDDDIQERAGRVSAVRAGSGCEAAERSSPWRVHASPGKAVEP